MFVRRSRTHRQRFLRVGRSEGRATGRPPGRHASPEACGTTQERGTSDALASNSEICRFERAERARPYKFRSCACLTQAFHECRRKSRREIADVGRKSQPVGEFACGEQTRALAGDVGRKSRRLVTFPPWRIRSAFLTPDQTRKSISMRIRFDTSPVGAVHNQRHAAG